MPTMDVLPQTVYGARFLSIDKRQFEQTGGERDQFLPCRFIAKGILPASVFQLLSSNKVAFRMCSFFGLWVIKA